jgi:hypothetical protein
MFSSIKAWFTQPFAGSLSVWNYTCIIGLILVLIVLWSRVIGLLVGFGEGISDAVA